MTRKQKLSRIPGMTFFIVVDHKRVPVTGQLLAQFSCQGAAPEVLMYDCQSVPRQLEI